MYKGTILFVSHDHDFVQHVADTILELTPNSLHLYNGDYESYLYHKQVAQLSQQQDQIRKSVESQKKKTEKDPNQQRQLKKQLGTIETQIKKLEAKRDAMGERLSGLIYGAHEYDELLSKLTKIDRELEQKNDEWEQIMQKYIAQED